MKYIIKGEAEVYKNSGEDNVVDILIKGSDLQQFDGQSDQSIFSDYFHDKEKFLLVSGGYLDFEYDKETKKLYAVTTYDAVRKLDEKEEKMLLDYTTGQWSDGIGESFEQNPVDDIYYLSAWYSNQKATITFSPLLT